MIGNIDKVITKRCVLATTAKLFDPLGLISPAIMPLKLIFQQLCKENNDWDFPCSGPILTQWFNIIKDMQETGRICFDRFYLDRQLSADDIDFIDLHGFCEAPLNAYGVHIVYTLKSGEKFPCLISSKTRIAPIGGETVPRLQLLAALILARFMNSVKQENSNSGMRYTVVDWKHQQNTKTFRSKSSS